MLTVQALTAIPARVCTSCFCRTTSRESLRRTTPYQSTNQCRRRHLVYKVRRLVGVNTCNGLVWHSSYNLQYSFPRSIKPCQGHCTSLPPAARIKHQALCLQMLQKHIQLSMDVLCALQGFIERLALKDPGPSAHPFRNLRLIDSCALPQTHQTIKLLSPATSKALKNSTCHSETCGTPQE